MATYNYGSFSLHVPDDAPPSPCVKCGSIHTKNKGSFDKCLDCGHRYRPANVTLHYPAVEDAP